MRWLGLDLAGMLSSTPRVYAFGVDLDACDGRGLGSVAGVVALGALSLYSIVRAYRRAMRCRQWRSLLRSVGIGPADFDRAARRVAAREERERVLRMARDLHARLRARKKPPTQLFPRRSGPS